MKKFLFLFFFFSFIFSCRKEEDSSKENVILNKYLNLPFSPYNYSQPSLPEYFYNQFVTVQDNTPTDNIITNEGATLGRVLFYDNKLSINDEISCSSCHIQEFGFTDTAKLSKGVNGFTGRHSMSLINARYYNNGRFFWDERAATLEEQVLMPIQDSIEMGMSLDNLVIKLSHIEYYPILFEKAFGDKEITKDRISKALSQFVRSIISVNSKFDQGRKSVEDVKMPFPNFSKQENIGKNIFFTHRKVNCSSCHITEVFVQGIASNNGLSRSNIDPGIMVHTNMNIDRGKFKAPSLKSISLRKRFMHDGSLEGLMQVVEHYDHKINNNTNLDPHLIDVSTRMPVTMDLSQDEKEALVAFLHTLTDNELIIDEKFSNPFK